MKLNLLSLVTLYASSGIAVPAPLVQPTGQKIGTKPGQQQTGVIIDGNTVKALCGTDRFSCKLPEPIKWETQVYFGDEKIDWGCDTGVEESAKPAFDDLCDGAGCNEGREFTRQVNSRGNGKALTKGPVADLTIRFESTGFESDKAVSHYRSALMALINPKTVSLDNAKYTIPVGPSPAVEKTCSMRRFPNFIRITRRVAGDPGVVDEIKMFASIKNEESEASCLAQSVIGDVAGMFSGPWAAAFGAITGHCGGS